MPILDDDKIKHMNANQLLKCLKKLEELETKYSKEHKKIFETVFSSSESSSSSSDTETEEEEEYENKIKKISVKNKNAIRHKKKQK
jgi:hypothetical protein